ncbi:hypothetical protein [Tautonia plasticadhaerens]|uniref:Uncharacterized protein n=1 Tax=Tautonia plasticadhaerens TaxID=2527974 RepID=A0A518H0G8_9BACT|nr:hypothetical protein [Tautonia plasticadhaerens]QDV34327.1 hypothetical protein ElP_22120 [Tautonia plasticadhaerens]
MSRLIDLVRVLPLAAAVAIFVGCESQGPVEEAGENIDNAASDVGDALDPAGPAEEAGQAVDDAVGN